MSTLNPIFRRFPRRAGLLPKRCHWLRSSSYVTHASSLKPHGEPTSPPLTPLKTHIVKHFNNNLHNVASIPSLLEQYHTRDAQILNTSLLNESNPRSDRKVVFGDDEVVQGGDGFVLIAHVVLSRDHLEMSFSGGFFIQPGGNGNGPEACLVTCGHTFQQIRASPILNEPTCRSAVFALVSPSEIYTISSILTSLPRYDLAVMAVHSDTGGLRPRTMPVAMYPAPSDTPVRIHLSPVSSLGLERSTWGKWVPASIAGYRDFAGREAVPGTYDSLAHLLFRPPPTHGSSGGPIIDSISGAVVGIVTGSRMDNRVEGLRGWGAPSEALFELFSLPGFTK